MSGGGIDSHNVPYHAVFLILSISEMILIASVGSHIVFKILFKLLSILTVRSEIKYIVRDLVSRAPAVRPSDLLVNTKD